MACCHFCHGRCTKAPSGRLEGTAWKPLCEATVSRGALVRMFKSLKKVGPAASSKILEKKNLLKNSAAEWQVPDLWQTPWCCSSRSPCLSLGKSLRKGLAKGSGGPRCQGGAPPRLSPTLYAQVAQVPLQRLCRCPCQQIPSRLCRCPCQQVHSSCCCWLTVLLFVPRLCRCPCLETLASHHADALTKPATSERQRSPPSRSCFCCASLLALKKSLLHGVPWAL